MIPPEKTPFFPKTNALSLLERCQFHGLDTESPHEHLEDFKAACEFMKTHGVEQETIYMTMFP